MNRTYGLTLFAASLALVMLSGCSLLHAPENVVSAVVPGARSQSPDPVDLQLQLQRFADDYLARGGMALDSYAQAVGTEEARLEALRFKLAAATSVISIASGPNPNLNLLDMVAVTVLSRMTVADYWVKTRHGDAYGPWLQASQGLETNVWMIASTFLGPSQVEELRSAINQWYALHPDVRTAFFARPYEFGSMVRTARSKGGDFPSVFSLANLDPTTGLDPAVREITRTRLFAERAMFTAQRMPFLLRMQAELLTLEVAAQPAAQATLTNLGSLTESADRLSRATDAISRTATKLPDQVKAEREAILNALEEQEGKLKALAAQAEQTFESARKMSESLSTTIGTFDVLMKRFGVGEPSPNPVATRQSNAEPFRILDYAQTAAQITDMAREVNLLVSNVNEASPKVEALSRKATAEAQALADHFFRSGLMLILVFLGGGVLAGLTYRFIVAKVSARGSGAGAAKSGRAGERAE